MPKVSVLLPVFNGEKYLAEAIRSILSQTFVDFELILLNDGSTDRSAEIMESFQDQRIRIHHNQTNQKLIATLNIGLELATGQYLARMDADDISLPDRFEKQVAYLDQHPECALVGSNYKSFGSVEKDSDLPLAHDEIYLEMFFSNPIAHPTVMLRGEVIRSNGLRYNAEHLHLEDIGLWFEIIRFGKLHTLPHKLIYYRVDGQNISVQNYATHRQRSEKMFAEKLRLIDSSFGEREAKLHYAITYGMIESETVDAISAYLQHLEIRLKSMFPAELVSKKVVRLKRILAYKFAEKSVANYLRFARRVSFFRWSVLIYAVRCKLGRK